MDLLFTALLLAVALEGMLYALFPSAMQRMMVEVLRTPPDRLRLIGLGAAAMAVLGLWLLRGGFGGG